MQVCRPAFGLLSRARTGFAKPTKSIYVRTQNLQPAFLLPGSEERMIEIYKIIFPDGSAYIGQTRTGIKKRIAQHKCHPCNQKLYNKFLITPSPKIQVLSRHLKQKIADGEERKQILRLKDPINIYAEGHPIQKNPEAEKISNNRWPSKRNRRPRKKYPRKPSGYHVCSWCWQKLPVSEFYTDRNRSTGLASRCKRCSLHRLKRLNEVIRKGGTASEAYFWAKQERQQLRQTRTRPVISAYERG